VLEIVNRRLLADFATERFLHATIWDPEHEWIELRLRSRVAQRSTLVDLGLEVVGWWTDPAGDFALSRSLRC